ncbi:MAG TPA: hypothetical protein P5571_03700 [Candidatus Krumholzibacteria bacterium]|nr:hypothetical protein [Candidatus Krumholzibacteria bacterium]HRX50445.1 hypothetical protein [Candidatus Krumholzibacteria bacterium]
MNGWSVSTSLEVWVGALLTLMVFSFLWRDNPFYKFAEHLFVGVSAAYWMVVGFWTTLWPRVVVPLVPGAVKVVSPEAEAGPFDPLALLPALLGLLMLCRMVPRLSGLARWPTAFVLGTTAGYTVVRYVRSDFLNQIRAAVGEGVLLRTPDGRLDTAESVAAAATLLGTLACLHYFMNTRREGRVSSPFARLGLLVLMITFGASFGSAVMARISLLVGRLQELMGSWLGLI